MDKKQKEEITGKLEEIDVTGGIDFCTSTQPVQNAIRSHALYNSGKFAIGIANETPRPNDVTNRVRDPNNKDPYSDLNVRGGGLD